MKLGRYAQLLLFLFVVSTVSVYLYHDYIRQTFAGLQQLSPPNHIAAFTTGANSISRHYEPVLIKSHVTINTISKKEHQSLPRGGIQKSPHNNKDEKPHSQEVRNVKPHPQDGHCRDVLCTEYLTKLDWNNFTLCRMRTTLKLSRQEALAKGNHPELLPTDLLSDPLTSGTCKFMNGTGRDIVGLVSFPGSGNTWVRGLIQTVTGICTGAVYCDRILRSSGFDGEGVCSSSVIVIKDHSPMTKWTRTKKVLQLDKKGRPHYDKVIFIIRNPFHALVSEWNRQLSTKFGLGNTKTSHTDSFGKNYFGSFNKWDVFVRNHIQKWVWSFDWILKCPSNHSFLVVRYEDLKEDRLLEVKKMLRFLQFTFSDSGLSDKLDSSFVRFHRTDKLEFDHFTRSQREIINKSITMVTESLDDKFSHMYGVDEYLDK